MYVREALIYVHDSLYPQRQLDDTGLSDKKVGMSDKPVTVFVVL